MMDFRPTLRVQPSSSDLILQPSPDAYGLARAYRGSAVKEPEVVKEEAKVRIREAGGDPRCWQLVLSESELQFGQYWGQTFRWLLSHDVGYAAAVVASHQKEREGGDASQSPLAVHKDALASYVQLFPEVVAAVQWTRRREGSLSVRDVDQELVGFGAHATETYRSLYESASSESQSYVQWVRTAFVQPGSKPHNLQVYVLGRDREADASPPSPQPGARVGATDPELTDSKLAAAAMEVNSQVSSSSDAPPAPALPPPQPEPAAAAIDDAPPPLTSGALASSSQLASYPDATLIKKEEEEEDEGSALKLDPTLIKKEEEEVDEGDVRGPDGDGRDQLTIRLVCALVDPTPIKKEEGEGEEEDEAMEVDFQLYSSSSSDAPPTPALPPRQPGPATIDDAPPPLTSGALASSSQSTPHPDPTPIEEEDKSDVIAPDCIGGDDPTFRLACALVELRHRTFMTQQQVAEITALWEKLSDQDKEAASFPRLFPGKSNRMAQSPSISQLVEAVFLELCRIHKNSAILGVRFSRWLAIRRDYMVIKHNCKEFLAAVPIQLFEVNHRTLHQWHKAVRARMVPAALPQVKAAETGDHVRDKASDLAVAPGKHKLLYDPSAPAASSSSSGSIAAAATPALTPAPTTAWQRKKREEQRRRAEEQGVLLRPPRKVFTKFECRHCSRPKTRAYGHSRYGLEHYCAQVGGRSVEEWLQEKRAADPRRTQPRPMRNLPSVGGGLRMILPKIPPKAALPLSLT